MQFENVCLESVGYVLPAEQVTSAAIEEQLADVYERLHLPAGRLELMTGIKERRFFAPRTLPGQFSARAAQLAVEAAELPRDAYGALIHGSVCRDQMEPATANMVHHVAGLPEHTLVLDVSNACLGLLNGAVILAQMIELGQIKAGVVVGAELGRNLVEGTIATLKADTGLTRKSIKPAFASLTIGSASVAMTLCHRSLSQRKTGLIGGVWKNDTAAHELCAGGGDTSSTDDRRPLMATDSEALLEAGIRLAERTWEDAKTELGWSQDSIQHAFTHQVGKAHRSLLLERLGLPGDCDYPIHDRFGNTGAVALPLSLALGAEAGHVPAGSPVALLGIGSGLNSLMLGLDWQSLAVKGTVEGS